MRKMFARAAFLFAVLMAVTLLPIFTPSAQAAVKYPQNAVVKVKSVYLRKTTSSKSAKLILLHKGDQVIVNKASGSRYQLTFEKDSVTYTGYVYKKYITLKGAVVTETPAPAETTPVVTTPKDPNSKVICIDAGHQAKGDNTKEPIGPGSSTKKKKVSYGTAGKYTKVPEYKLTLTVALKLQKELEARGYTVVMVRTTHNVNISNSQRAEIANKCDADAFIRIHANGSSNKSANGAETLCMTAKNPWNANLYEKSYSLSKCVVDSMCAKTGVKNKGVITTDKMSGINWCKVPVTIVEMGYMSNKAEDKKMQTEEFQTNVVTGIANGIDLYFSK